MPTVAVDHQVRIDARVTLDNLNTLIVIDRLPQAGNGTCVHQAAMQIAAGIYQVPQGGNTGDVEVSFAAQTLGKAIVPGVELDVELGWFMTTPCSFLRDFRHAVKVAAALQEYTRRAIRKPEEPGIGSSPRQLR